MTESAKLEAWAIVELMGHVKMAGRVTEEERFGAKMGRIDIPMADGGFTTQYFQRTDSFGHPVDFDDDDDRGTGAPI